MVTHTVYMLILNMYVIALYHAAAPTHCVCLKDAVKRVGNFITKSKMRWLKTLKRDDISLPC